jgi:MFS family permease
MAISATVETLLETLDETARRRGILFLALAAAGVGFAMAVLNGVNSNFVAQEMRLTPQQQGLLEGIRETCGITALGVLALFGAVAEPVLGAGMLALVSLGLAGYLLAPDFPWLVAASLVWSQGFHVWMPLPQSMALALAEPGKAGRLLGRIAAAGAAGAAAGLGVAWLMGALAVPIRSMFAVAGLVVLIGGACCLGVPRKIKAPGCRLVFRRKYGLYYLLCFLEGWRKQIFVAFAGFLLVRKYGTPVTTMIVLWLVIQGLTWLVSPWVGRLIDRVGERPVLVAMFAGLAVFFTGYALVERPVVLYAMYVLDSVFFVGVMALTTYVNRLAPPEEHTATLSAGVACNHVAACLMPLTGGFLWGRWGHQAVFLLGAGVAILSLVPALMLPSGAAPAAAGAQPAEADI